MKSNMEDVVITYSKLPSGHVSSRNDTSPVKIDGLQGREELDYHMITKKSLVLRRLEPP
jgi:hypothetical protein